MAPWIERHAPADAHVTVTDVTSGTTLMTVQGPRSRELLSRLTSADLTNDAFPYLTAREIDLDYARVLALRVTYVGELGWELHVPTELAADRLRRAAAGRPGPWLPQRRTRRDGQPAPREGVPRLRPRHRQHRHPARRRARLRRGLGQARRLHRARCALSKRRSGPPTRRLVQVLLQDPGPTLFGGEPVLRDGRWLGYVRAGAYGHTLGGAVGLAMIEDDAGLPVDAVESAPPSRSMSPARAIRLAPRVRPMYDPDRRRITA